MNRPICLPYLVTLTIVSCSFCCTQVRAEIYGPPGDFGWRKSVPLQLILHEAVISDLDISEEVARKLRDLQDRIQKEFEEAIAKARSSSDPQSRRSLPKEFAGKNPRMLHTIRNQYIEQINSLLTLEQQNRLHQIHLQYGTLSSNARLFPFQLGLGLRRNEDSTDVLSDSAVALELRLTDGQQMQIRDIHLAITRAEGAKVKMGKSYNGPNYLDLRDERSEKIMKVLTKEQQEAFEKLKGRPLRIGPAKQP